jgi:fructose-1,6-bisphosphate aldolase class II
MLNSSKELLIQAKNEKYCIPQFNINNLEWTRYILETVNNLNYPVILGVSEGAINYMGGYYTVVGMVKGLIHDLNIKVPVILHLDHGSSVESCIKAIDAGFSSVMIDASKLDMEENIKLTKQVVEYAHGKDIAVEGELGRIGGSEDNVTNNIEYTQIEDAIRYIKETNVDSFAPSIGSVHGRTSDDSILNIELLKEINSKITIPLVLHGGSGVNSVQIKEAINHGISKININTELQVAWSKAIREYLKNNNDIYDPRKIISSGKMAMVNVITDRIKLYRD